MTITIKAAQRVTCPFCQAQPGKPCISRQGGVLRRVVHTGRRIAAAEKK